MNTAIIEGKYQIWYEDLHSQSLIEMSHAHRPRKSLIWDFEEKYRCLNYKLYFKVQMYAILFHAEAEL